MVLVERGGIGRTEQFLPVATPGRAHTELIPMRITGVSPTGLIGEPMRAAA
jgi:threonylcarbamoyladenosine tRNA methylthiotransferase MtaB